MPANIARDYHPKWSLIRRLIQRRAGDACEHCGAQNGDMYATDPETGVCRAVSGHDARTSLREGWRIVMIQCGAAHLDQDRDNNRFDNLAFLCRACHLNHDRPFNQGKIQMTKRYGRREGQGNLF